MEEFRLYDVSARKLQPATGTFLIPDPLWKMTPSTGSYTYANHDPINFFDPTGLTPYTITIKVTVTRTTEVDPKFKDEPTAGPRPEVTNTDILIEILNDKEYQEFLAEGRSAQSAANAASDITSGNIKEARMRGISIGNHGEGKKNGKGKSGKKNINPIEMTIIDRREDGSVGPVSELIVTGPDQGYWKVPEGGGPPSGSKDGSPDGNPDGSPDGNTNLSEVSQVYNVATTPVNYATGIIQAVEKTVESGSKFFGPISGKLASGASKLGTGLGVTGLVLETATVLQNPSTEGFLNLGTSALFFAIGIFCPLCGLGLSLTFMIADYATQQQTGKGIRGNFLINSLY